MTIYQEGEREYGMLLADGLQAVSKIEIENRLRLLPEWRRQKAMSYHFDIDRLLCAEAYLLLCKGLKTWFGIKESPEFDYGPQGKPFLRNYPDIHFNLSHCHKAAMCVISEKPIGCDIEEIPDKIDEDLCRMCFNDKEIAEIHSDYEPCISFTMWWTKKEALLKRVGIGLIDDMPSLDQNNKIRNATVSTSIKRNEGYVFSIAY